MRAAGARHRPALSRRAGARRASTSRCAPAKCTRCMGQNGAGKSTLIKVLTGVARARRRQHRLLGRPVDPPTSPLRCAAPGHQHRLPGSATSARTSRWRRTSSPAAIRAGRWTRGGGIDWRETERRARELLAGLGIDIDVDAARSAAYPVAVQQMVAIARAVGIEARVLILDEPTSSLDERRGRARCSRCMRRLRDKGMAILFVTHFLDQVYAICDRITVLRNGRLVGEYACGRARPRGAGRRDGGPRAARPRQRAAPRARRDASRAPRRARSARHLARRGQLKPVDLELARRRGRWASPGLLGSGRTELARLLFGARRARPRRDQHRRHSRRRSTIRRMRCGYGLGVLPRGPQDTSGIVAELSVRENIALALQARMGLGEVPDARRAAADRRAAASRALGIKTAEHRDADRPAVRRQPAEGHASRAGWPREPRAADPRRTHARHRRRRQAGNHERDPASWRAAAWRCCSSRRRSTRWCACRTASWCCATARKVGELPRRQRRSRRCSTDRGSRRGHAWRIAIALCSHRAVLAAASRWRCCSCVERRLQSRLPRAAPGATATCTAASSTSSTAPRRSMLVSLGMTLVIAIARHRHLGGRGGGDRRRGGRLDDRRQLGATDGVQST